MGEAVSLIKDSNGQTSDISNRTDTLIEFGASVELIDRHPQTHGQIRHFKSMLGLHHVLPEFEQFELDEASLLLGACSIKMASDEFLIIRVVHTTHY